MAVTKITWENKTGIQNDESVARKNKVMDGDMNEIKQVVNNNADELNTAQSNIEDLQSGQSTSNADITNIKNRISTLETDNKTNKSDISALKSDNTTNKENISTLQEQVSNKVDKVEGKGLSTNDYTTEEKQKLAGLKNYDDTEVKKDISDIKEEQETQNTNIENLQENDTTQDELIEKLQQENKNIKSALINVETEQAKSLHIEDASTVSAQLSVEGNAEQETREGYNLLNSSLFNLSEVSNYATFNKEDGTITFNGTVNADINIRSLRKQIIAGTGKENIVIKIISGSLNGLLRLVAQDTDYNNLVYTQIGTSSFTNKLTENIEYNIFSISITSGTVMNNLKLGFMIIDNSDLQKEYEPYGAMPSPKFPSAIISLGSNKNLYPGWEKGSVNGTTGQLEDTISNYIRSIDFISVFPNKKYTIKSYNIENINELNTAARMYNSDKEYLGSDYIGLIQDDSITFTLTNEDVRYIKIVSSNNSAITETSKVDIKLEEGTEATSYSPYGQGSTEIKKISKNLLDDTAYKNVTITSQNDISAIDYQKFDNFKKNKTYIVRIWFTDGTYVDDSNIMLYGYNSNKTIVDAISNTASEMYDNADEIKYVKLQINSSGLEKHQNKTIRGIQIEEGSVVTDYEEHQQENDVLPIQQEMLNGDYFELEEDGWKEVHIWSKIRFLNQDFKKSTKTEVTRYFVANIVNIVEDRNNTVVLSEHFLGIPSVQNDNNELGISNYNDNGFLINIDKADTNFDTLEKFETFLQNNEVYAYYKTTTPTKLACTEEQSAILDKLNELDMLNGTNNIITTEDIALLKLKYVVDTKTYIDNQINERLSNIENQIVNLSGGN